MNFSNVTTWTIPEGSVTQVTDSLNRVIWQKVQPVVLKNYFYVEDASGSENTLTIKKRYNAAPTITVYYSTDQENWTRMGSTNTTGRTVTIPANGKLYLKCTTSTWCTYDGTYDCNNCITASNSFNVGGNIMSLLYGGNFEDKTTFAANTDRNFCRLFDINSTVNNHLINSSNLILPATTLTPYCYRSMFQECASMTAAPATIPATTLASYCCQDMFSGCSSLTTAPELPATTLADGCYYFMFYACSSLTTAPTTLPATTLADSCYQDMFSDCTSLTTAPVLSATTLATQCYYGMFNGCSSLTTAPALLATTLTNNCYGYMFGACTSLNEITTYANDISASGCLTNWLSNVAASGTFHNEGTAVYTVDSPSGIPQGWTEVKPNYFYVEDVSGADNTLSITKSTADAPTIEVYKSTDTRNWVSMGTTDTTAITATIPANGKLYLKATTTKWESGNTGFDYDSITASGSHNVGGNIMSLLYGENFEGQTTFPTNSDGNFTSLFTNNTTLVNASNLTLPVTTLTIYCYWRMFDGCTSLTTPPVLSATTLAQSCYESMFNDCSSLTTAPVLPASTLAQSCYKDMFNGCSSLTTAPALNATTLGNGCYRNMFYRCTSLTTVPVILPATTLAYACYYGMFQNCTSLTAAPELPATTLTSNCYAVMFQNCTSLTAAPELPATTLVDSCYAWMFQGCTNLGQVITNAINISANYCTYYWLDNVAAQGDFYNNNVAPFVIDDPSGIPQGWVTHTSL